MAWVCKSCGILWTRVRTLKTVHRKDVPYGTCPDCILVGAVGKGGEN